MADNIKQRLDAPKLPNVIRGDGRYEIGLIKAFLEQTAKQVNLANGFLAKEVTQDNMFKVPTPKNFFVTFNKLGAVVTWDNLEDVGDLLCYELRENTDVGSNGGLLERTLNNEVINKVPLSYQGKIYLFAINKNNEHSRASEITYTKPRPQAPQDISLTKNNEGTLITFLEIPTNCIGANIYVDGTKHSTLDNVFLFKHEVNNKIKTVEIAYYDIFGEGERAVINCFVPDVEGFLVERNGANLDFYWNAINVYNIKYEVRVSSSNEWYQGVELFTTKLNKHRYVHPNAGEYFFLIKAIDEHGNYSENATYVLTSNALELSRNVVATFPQDIIAYSGHKNNLYYDTVVQGLRLEREAVFGEYIMPIVLPKKYRARNWLDLNIIGTSNNTVLWRDCNFRWDSLEASMLTWAGEKSTLGGIVLRKEIAKHTGLPNDTDIDLISLNETLTTTKGVAPYLATNASTFKNARFLKGLQVSNDLKLEYKIPNMTSVFSVIFSIKKTTMLQDCVILVLANDEGSYIFVGYDNANRKFYIQSSDNQRVEVNTETTEKDWIDICITQGELERSLFVKSFGTGTKATNKCSVSPIGVLNNVYISPKLPLAIRNATNPINSVDYAIAINRIGFASVTVNYVLSNVILLSKEITLHGFDAMSSKATEYDEFREFNVGDYEYEKALIRIVVKAGSTQSQPLISNVVHNVDVEDVIDKGVVSITDTTSATKVRFNKFYYNAPFVQVSVNGGSSANNNVVASIVATDKQDSYGRYFEVELLSGGARVTGLISWVSTGY